MWPLFDYTLYLCLCVLLMFMEVDSQATVSLDIAQGQYLLFQCNSKIQISCVSIQGEVLFEPQWQPVTAGMRVERIRHDMGNEVNQTAVLIIDKFERESNGRFTCSVNTPQPVRRDIEVNCVEVNTAKAVYQYRDKTQLLECTVQVQSPILQVKFQGWYQNDKPIKDLKNPKFVEEKNGSLVINGPRREDANRYIAKYSATLKGDVVHDFNCVVNYIATPLLLDFKKSYDYFLGQNFSMTPHGILGYPRPSLKWLKNGARIPNNSRHIYAQDEFLIITKLGPADAAVYTCIAYTKELNANSTKEFILRVKNPMEWLYPFIGCCIQAVILCISVIVCLKNDKYQEAPPKKKLEPKVIIQPVETVKKKNSFESEETSV
ncbi:protogenin-like isoform X2 [Physella acuta]|uniref:protogenin-like isoform X2 n=1 Tax=Physella acuta TaxID=109671 RepID=UPI0027DCBEB9|nr:protogenin-like isoform X2 [Physella acuta]